MKLNKYIFSLLCLLLMTSLSVAQSYKVITVPAPGELDNNLDDDWDEMDSIVVKGTINKADFRTLYNCARFGKLTVINLEYATIENNTIPEYALYYPDVTFDFLNIRRVILPDNVVEIGRFAFTNSRIQEINLPASLKKLSDGLFWRCEWFSANPLVIPEGITEIPNNCFSGCKAFKKLVLPQSLKKIGAWAFYDTRMEEMNLPEGLENIREYAFFASEKLKEIVIPGTVTNLGDGCFQETFSLQSITLSQNITEIPVSFLERNKNLTSLVIPDNVTVIHDNAFYGPIKEVQMSKNLKRIGKDAFRENFLTEVVLPVSIEYIDQGAFRLSDFLERVYCMAKTPPMTAYYNINNDNESYEPFCIFQSNKDLTLYVPVGSGDLYRESPYWVDFDNIVETNDFPSSVGRASATDCQITSFGGEIRVDNPTDMPVSVNIYAINGSLVRQEKVVGTFALTVSPGIYLVKVNDKAQKVLVE